MRGIRKFGPTCTGAFRRWPVADRSSPIRKSDSQVIAVKRLRHHRREQIDDAKLLSHAGSEATKEELRKAGGGGRRQPARRRRRNDRIARSERGGKDDHRVDDR